MKIGTSRNYRLEYRKFIWLVKDINIQIRDDQRQIPTAVNRDPGELELLHKYS